MLTELLGLSVEEWSDKQVSDELFIKLEYDP